MSDIYSGRVWRLLVEQPARRVPHVLGDVSALHAERLAGQPGRPVSDMVLELRRNAGPVSPSGMIGGSYIPGKAEAAILSVGKTGDITTGAGLGYVSGIGKRGMVLGLPDEFAESVMDGLIRVDPKSGVPAGRVVIDRAAYDEMDSSRSVFERLGGLFLIAVAEMSMGSSDQSEFQRTMQAAVDSL